MKQTTLASLASTRKKKESGCEKLPGRAAQMFPRGPPPLSRSCALPGRC